MFPLLIDHSGKIVESYEELVDWLDENLTAKLAFGHDDISDFTVRRRSLKHNNNIVK
jgi:hypothetical protein